MAKSGQAWHFSGQRDPAPLGVVYLVGAGPGDPGLITQRGAELLRKADCVIYDRLVNPRILKLAPRGCERIYAGRDERGRRQMRINRLMVTKAREHSTVVRLKGGDPALFGRMSEELETLEQAGIPHEVVPGVSSPWAAATALGMPLTDRRLSSSVAFVTGHLAAGKRSPIRWKELARGADTLVILMGRVALSRIVRRLTEAGRPASSPIALVRWASAPQQGILVSTLGQVGMALERRTGFGPPVVAIVGEVVRLARIHDGETPAGSLDGKGVLLTRPAGENESLKRRFEEIGGRCRILPTIRIRPRRLTTRESRQLLARLPGYDWLLLNSHHGVETLADLAGRFGKRVERLVRGKVCVIGPRTEQAARSVGLRVDLVPPEFSTEGVRRTFVKMRIRGKKILIPRSDLAVGDRLAQALRRRGAQVDEVALYETRRVKIPARRLKAALKGLRAATFTSASTARSFVQALKEAGLSPRCAFNGTAVVAIGPATARALRRSGVRRVHLPDRSWTAEGLVSTVARVIRGHNTYFERGRYARK